MLKHARGVLCAPITISRCDELDLPRQVVENTSVLGTPFTVTVDKLEGCSTGVSAHDRAETIKALADPELRQGHSDALPRKSALCTGQRRAQKKRTHGGNNRPLQALCLYPAGALMEIMNDDGTMARLPQLVEFAAKYNLKVITIKDLIAYRLQRESLISVGTMWICRLNTDISSLFRSVRPAADSSTWP